MTPANSAENLEELAKYRVLAFQEGITTTHWPHEFKPSWLSDHKPSGAGSDYVKLTQEQATLITGRAHPMNVYDKSITSGLNLNAYLKNQRSKYEAMGV